MSSTAAEDTRLVSRIGASARTTESRALFIAAAAFVLAFLVALPLVGGASLPIAGAGSIGVWAGLVAAIAAAVAFTIGYLLPAPGATRRSRPEATTWRLVLDIVALALAHAFTTLLLIVGLSIVLAQAFLGAVVFSFTSCLLIAATAALASYVAFLSAAGMTATRVATVLAVYLVVGVMAAMLSASDAEWWQKNISALGMDDDFSSWIFNSTLIVAGAVITAIASYLAVELAASGMAQNPREADDRREHTRIQVLRWALVLLGVFLAGVGAFPVNWIEAIHNIFGTGLVVIFGGMVIGIHWIVPRMPLVFVIAGFVFLGIVVAASVLFALGIYNLTAVEIIAFALIFTWLILLIRNISAGTHDSVRLT